MRYLIKYSDFTTDTLTAPDKKGVVSASDYQKMLLQAQSNANEKKRAVAAIEPIKN